MDTYIPESIVILEADSLVSGTYQDWLDQADAIPTKVNGCWELDDEIVPLCDVPDPLILKQNLDEALDAIIFIKVVDQDGLEDEVAPGEIVLADTGADQSMDTLEETLAPHFDEEPTLEYVRTIEIHVPTVEVMPPDPMEHGPTLRFNRQYPVYWRRSSSIQTRPGPVMPTTPSPEVRAVKINVPPPPLLAAALIGVWFMGMAVMAAILL